ncbi:MAG TPA: PilC/PilY family type IV pilus protein [Steroidobacteraceae bacterium]|nr:PilC/PilY family type IV pilus protein [Steroidobacteraceae bacterium]
MHSDRRILRLIAWFTIATFGMTNALADPLTLATSPLVTGLGKVVAPNIFFVLDDSLSMNDEFLPDSVDNDYGNGGSDAKACALNFGYNTIYYNPSTTYNPPLNADGSSYANATFTAAKGGTTGGFSSGSTVVDLSASSPVYTTYNQTLGSNPIATTNGNTTITVTHPTTGYSPSTPAYTPAVGDQVTISGVTGTSNKVGNISINTINGGPFNITAIVDSTHFKVSVGGSANGNGGSGGGSSVKVAYKHQTGSDANYFYYNYTGGGAYSQTSPPSTCASSSSYTRVPASGQTWTSAGISSQQQQNFANWYSYYRTRLLMMKSAAGRAFTSVNDQYRVGFTVISDTGVTGSKFLDIAKFSDTTATGQKGKWFATLYGTNGSSFTPLRGALSKAGRYYAGKFSSGSTHTHDPVQYSCQKNFTIMATDGSWNSNSPESPTSDSTSPGSASNNYGPFEMDNVTRVGDQDGVSGVLPPYKDSSAAQNTLADVAYYYYNTDLRPAGSIGGLTDEGTNIDVSADNVPASTTDPVAFQHMTTYTLGLGLSGSLANPGDYAAIVAGTKNWPNPIASGSNQDTYRIDDLWHAAVNGHGIDSTGANLSAKDPDAVVTQLSKALQSISAVVGSSAAAATSNLQPIDGDNTAYIGQFKTVAWTGDLLARTIDVVTGAITTTNTWQAQTLLDGQNPTTGRYIYAFKSGATGNLRTFTYANLTTTEKTYFNSDSTNPGGALTQYATWSSNQKTNASASAMVDYLRGVRTNEVTSDSTADAQLFRQREHVLGDVVDSAPVFVRKPPFSYTDTGYSTFLANEASRAATVYVGGNDGMLHAFDGTTGQSGSGKERWAYIPAAVLPNLYKLAASDYSTNHRFYVDGPISIGDAYNSSTSSWSTILVGGLGAGGKGYYALDVTDPANPKALWEFTTATDADVGYSYGNPIITKRASDNKWVVLFTSGYNNTSGDKKGHLFVVDAFTGAELSDIATTTTANEQLSGIGRIANYVEQGLVNNVTQYVYGGDLNGSLWRFDISAGTALKLADTSSTAGNQPIMVRPELAKISSGGHTYTVLYFGTGRYLNVSGSGSLDSPSTSVAQAVYAVKDAGTYVGVLTSSGAAMVSQTLDTSTSPRTTTSATVDWASNNGWYVTTPAGELFNIDPGLQLGTLVIASNSPQSDYCEPTGSSILYQFSYTSGFLLTTNAFQAQTVGSTQVQLGGNSSGTVHGGKVVIESVLANGTTVSTDQKNGGGAAGTAKRISWREIE